MTSRSQQQWSLFIQTRKLVTPIQPQSSPIKPIERLTSPKTVKGQSQYYFIRYPQMWHTIILSLLILSIHSQSQTLSLNQTLSAGTSSVFDRVRAVDYNDSTRLLTVYGSLIKIWILSGGTWVSFNNVTAPEALEDTMFSNDASTIIGLADNSNTAYVFNNSGGNAYILVQNISLSVKHLSFGWAVQSNFSIFGGADGAIRVYSRNNGVWEPYQIIPVAVGTVNTTVGTVYIQQIIASNRTNDANSTRTNNTISTCSCNSGFTYIGGYCQQINCNVLAQNNSAGTSISVIACHCSNGYLWNPNTLSCVRDYIAVNNSNGVNYDDASCYCNTEYAWFGNACLLYTNCQGLANSPGTNSNSSACSCNTSYVYNSTARACVIDCSSVANSHGYNTTNISQCNCSLGYIFNNSIWESSGAVCIRDCNQIGLVRGYDRTDPTKCKCYDSFSWDNSSGVGVLDCGKVNYSTNTLKSNGRCQCDNKYRQDKVKNKWTFTIIKDSFILACSSALQTRFPQFDLLQHRYTRSLLLQQQQRRLTRQWIKLFRTQLQHQSHEQLGLQSLVRG